MLVAGSILLVIASGCTSVKRFKSATYKGQDDSLVDMALFGARLDAPGVEMKGRNLWDLSASAQTQLIQILDGRYPDNEQFTGAMNQEYLVKGTDPVMDYTTSNLRMVFTISRVMIKGAFSPGSRIAPTRMSAILTIRFRLNLFPTNVITLPEVISSSDLRFSISVPKAMVWAPAPIKALTALLARTPLPMTTAVAGGTVTTPPRSCPLPP